jgi:hypothetical protein
MPRLPAVTHRRLFDEYIPLFVASEMREIRDGGIGLARMFIPITFVSAETFWREAVDKNTGKLANGIALLVRLLCSREFQHGCQDCLSA